jgi:hypothetical protein
MTLKTRLAIGTSVLSIAGIAGIAPAAQAAPSVCGSRAFVALDRSISSETRAYATLLALEYRFTPRVALASFDQVAQCDPTTALNLYNEFAALAPAEAGNFQNAYWADYPADAASVFGGGISIF